MSLSYLELKYCCVREYNLQIYFTIVPLTVTFAVPAIVPFTGPCIVSLTVPAIVRFTLFPIYCITVSATVTLNASLYLLSSHTLSHLLTPCPSYRHLRNL